MLLNTAIFNQTVETAKAKSANNAAMLRAIDRAVYEINRSRYWSFADGVLRIQSTTRRKLYTVDDAHTCEAKTVCKHKVARRLMQRYTEALGVASAEGKGAAAPAPSAWSANGELTANGWKVRDEERANAPLISPSLYLRGEKYCGVDI